MKFFSIVIVLILSVVCNNNLFASYKLNKKKLELNHREELKREFSSLWTLNNYYQIKKSESTQVVTTNDNKDENNKKRPDTVRLQLKDSALNLFDAIQGNHDEQVEWIIKNSNSINKVNSEGYTPLHLVVLETIQLATNSEKHNGSSRKVIVNKTEIIKLLLNHGANTSIIDPKGKTVMDHVKSALKQTSKHTNPYRRLKRIKIAIKSTTAQKKLDSTNETILFEKNSPIITTEHIKIPLADSIVIKKKN